MKRIALVSGLPALLLVVLTYAHVNAQQQAPPKPITQQKAEVIFQTEPDLVYKYIAHWAREHGATETDARAEIEPALARLWDMVETRNWVNRAEKAMGPRPDIDANRAYVEALAVELGFNTGEIGIAKP